MKYVCLDLQTASYDRDSTCALGIILMSDQAELSHKDLLIRPPKLKFERSHLHGIRWQDVRGAPLFADAWQEIRELIDEAEFIAAYDAATQRQILWSTCTTSDVETPRQSFVCVKRLARSHWGMEDASLPALAQRLDVPLNQHQAISDAAVVAKSVSAFISEGHSVQRTALSPAPPIGSLPAVPVKRRRWLTMRRVLGILFLLSLMAAFLSLVAQNPAFFGFLYKMLESFFI